MCMSLRDVVVDVVSAVLCARGCFFKQKPAYEMRISDWSSDVCSSDLLAVVSVAVLLALLFWICLRSAERVVHVLGESGIDAVSRVMGFLLICMGEIGRAAGRERGCQYV